MDLMTAKTMAEVLAEHRSVDVPLYPDYYCCSCGNVSAEQPSVHQAEALSAAGFGLVADAKAEALEEAADDFERRAKNVRNNTYLESPSYQSFVEHAENHERNARWLRLRADALRGDS